MLWSGLKQKLNEKPMLGCFVTFPSPGLAELTARIGFDFTLIDNEHGIMNDIVIEDMIRASHCAGVPTVVRVAANQPDYFQKSLDSGANGVQVPMINTLGEAKQVVKATHYPPIGNRGFDFLPRTSQFGLTLNHQEYMTKLKKETLISSQIETVEAARNLDSLLEIKDIDVFFVGPVDLALSMGYIHDLNHEDVLKMIETCILKIKKSGKIAGIYAGSVEQTKEAIKYGARYIVTDLTTAMTQWSRQYLDSVRSLI